MKTITPLSSNLLAACFLSSLGSVANNIQVSNTTLTNNTGTTAKVQFDVSWENSWRGGGVANWDATWVFVKYHLSNGVWQHARIGATGHSAAAGSMLEMGLLVPGTAHNASTNPVMGAFLRRAADGSGNFTATGVEFFWDYAAQGIIASNDIKAVQVFAIEMVYMSEGAFHLGTGGTEANHFQTGPSSSPYQVTSESAITIANSTSDLWATGSIEASTLPAAFPKGYRAAYAMKYEISQQQYVEYLNTLTRSQQIYRVHTNIGVGVTTPANVYVMSLQNSVIFRQAITYQGPVSAAGPVTFTTSKEYLASNYLEQQDLRGYLDWSGLRLMTELEYEKACRGHLPPVLNEYAWASAAISSGATSYTLVQQSNSTEGIASGYGISSGNANFTIAGGDVFVIGPFRVGIFAAHASNNGRIPSGSGYYGAMELTGNVDEQVVSVGTASGRAYVGTHGDGDASGLPADWPLALMAKGGSFYTDPNLTGRVSIRSATSSGGGSTSGGRGIRTAP